MNVAYLINMYPKISSTFIRREIAALETDGVSVARFSIRRCAEPIVDGADKNELERTRTVLDVGAAGLILGMLRVALARPTRLARATWIAVKIGWRSDRGMLRHIAYLAEACVLLKWLAQSGAQHLHAHFGTNSAAAAMLCRVLGGPPYSFTVHGPRTFDKPEFLALTEKIKRASFVVAVSSFCRSQLYRWCSYEVWPKIHVIRCGVDEDFLAAPREPVPIAHRLVSVGRLSEEKGQLLLVEAVGRLVAEGLAVELILAGDGPVRGQLEALIEERGLRDHIRITGWATNQEVRRHILASRAMVLPSFAEGLPVVIMEAFALGRPVITTYIAGIPELVEPGVSGWLVPAGDACALVDAMREAVHADPERLQMMGSEGRRRVLKRHNTEVEARRLLKLFLSRQDERFTLQLDGKSFRPPDGGI